MGYISLNDFVDVSIEIPYGKLMGRWYGNRKERPILAMHGVMENLGTFDSLIPLLPDYLGVLCIDLQGHGHSSRLPAGMHYSIDDMILAIGRVMKQFKWTKVSLMGHSLGGILSFLQASLAPQTVDMAILLDVFLPQFDSAERIQEIATNMERHLVEEDRFRETEVQEPSSYTMDRLCNIMSKSTFNSVPVEFAQHLLNRSVQKSQLYPDKFYSIRDNRVKYSTVFPLCAEKALELAKGMRNNPFLVIKGSDSPFVNERSAEVIDYLTKHNTNFELHEVTGLHHVHLTNAEECAKHIVPFLRRHRPPPTGGKCKL